MSCGLRQKVAFLTATFPAASETFLVREFTHLRQSGAIDIRAFAIKSPPADGTDEDTWELSHLTTYLRPGRFIAITWANAVAVCTHPRRYAGAVRLVFDAARRTPPYTWPRLMFHLAAGVYLGARLQRSGYDAIHAHFSSATNIALFAHLVTGIEYTMTLHATDDLYHGTRPLLAPKLAHARKAVCNNLYNISFVNHLTEGKYADKLVNIYNGVDISTFRQTTAKRELSGALKILSVGNFTGVKGYQTVIAALHKLKESNLSFVYRIVGDGSANERRLIEKAVSQRDLDGCVELVGRLPFNQVREQLEWCDVEVMNSEIGEAGMRDGLPNVIIEAMLAKRLVVTTYVSDIPNIIRNEETGFLVPERNSYALATVLRSIALRFGETHAVVEKAHEFAVTNFDAGRNYAKLEAVLRTER